MVPAEVGAAKIATVMATEVAAMMAAEIVTLVVTLMATLVMAVVATLVMLVPFRVIGGGGHRDRIETVGRRREWGIAAPPHGRRELIGDERDQHGSDEDIPDHTYPPSLRGVLPYFVGLRLREAPDAYVQQRALVGRGLRRRLLGAVNDRREILQ
jgi:hypothetical protein